jgi:acyl-coenzyme A thioesterase PaaI-like protein
MSVSIHTAAPGPMPESFESRAWRWGGNLFPAYRRSGARITYVAPGFDEVHIKIPSNWKTRNHMGITWGGGLYSALDPIYGVMLYKILGGKYRVIDRTASIHFKRPGKTTLFARFRLSQQELEGIQTQLQTKVKLTRNYEINLVDKQGVVHAFCEKELCIMPL